MPDETSRGPEVPPEEDLLRGIVRPEWWDPEDDYVSPAVFGYPKFSAYIASMTTEETVVRKFSEGSGIIKFNCGVARGLGFDARHEPEQGDEAHANVYRTRRKKQARKLLEAETTVVAVRPDVEKLRASA